MDLRPGDTVFGSTESEQYRIVRLIGGGSFGIVYEVHDKNGTSFALKTITTASLDDSNLKSLINEGRLATEIHHENVLCVHYFHDGTQYPQLPPYMLMDFANGGTLDVLLSKRREQHVLLPENWTQI